MTFDAQVLMAIAGVVLSVAFTYIPKLNTSYAALCKEVKQLIMLGILVVSAGAIALLDNFGFVDAGIDLSTNQGIWAFVMVIITAVVANQGTHLIAPKPESVTKAKQ